MKRTYWLRATLLLLVFLLSRIADADEPSPSLAPLTKFNAFVRAECLRCHDAKTLEGGFDAEDLLGNANVDANPGAWRSVLERLTARDMPPKDEKRRPTEIQYAAAEQWLRKQLELRDRLAEQLQPRPLRRLSAVEYEHSVRSVFGVAPITVTDAFPPDETVEGFTHLTEGLSLSTLLVEKYVESARRVAELAVVDGSPPDTRKTVYRHDFGAQDAPKADAPIRNFDPGGAISSRLGKPSQWVGDHLYVDHIAPVGGRYFVRLRATPRNLAGRPKYRPNFEFRLAGKLLHDDDVEIQEGVPFQMEAQLPFDPGVNSVDFRWANGFPDNHYLRAFGFPLSHWSPQEGYDLVRLSIVLAKWDEARKQDASIPYPFPYFDDLAVEIEGPVFPHGWPPSQFQRDNAESIVGKNTKQIANWLLPKLYRRPATQQEVAQFTSYVTEARVIVERDTPQSNSVDLQFTEALRLAIQRVLVSPHFLFMVEPGPVGRQLNEHELAVRLSYFLWSEPPDAVLTELADQGLLRKSLAAQTKRMIADPRSSAFVDRFTREWLGLSRIYSAMPEPTLFPRFDPLLPNDMVREPIALVEHLLHQDGSIFDLLDADYAFVNDRLADHYHLPSLWSLYPHEINGFEPVSGGNFRKIALPDGRRGGLVTQAVFLSLTSENTRTSPVRRGVWILERLFNRPPPPPPPNVAGLLPKSADSSSAAERLKIHGDMPNCAGCHRRIDPLGLALENYDAVGEWRDREPTWVDPASPDANGAAIRKTLGLQEYQALPDFPIDASFKLGGIEGDGVEAIKRYLLANKGKFARGFTEKLATYALGRKLQMRDEAEIQRLLDGPANEAAKEHVGLQSLVIALVTSDLFQTH